MSELFPARGLLRSLVVLDGLAAALLLLLRLALAVLQALLQLGRRRARVRRRQRAVLRARGKALLDLSGIGTSVQPLRTVYTRLL